MPVALPRTRRIATAALLLSAALCGCLSGCLSGAPVPQQRYYRLVPSPIVPVRQALPAPPARPGIVLLAVIARGVYLERPLLHRAAAPAAPLLQYPYASWAEPPDLMLEDQLAGALRRAFGDQAVRRGHPAGPQDVRLTVRLHKLEQVIEAGKAQAAFAATFTAVDGQDRSLFVLDFDRQAPATGLSAMEFVAALDTLVAQAEVELIGRLSAAVPPG